MTSYPIKNRTWPQAIKSWCPWIAGVAIVAIPCTMLTHADGYLVSSASTIEIVELFVAIGAVALWALL